jgi:hypothetical protein
MPQSCASNYSSFSWQISKGREGCLTQLASCFSFSNVDVANKRYCITCYTCIKYLNVCSLLNRRKGYYSRQLILKDGCSCDANLLKRKKESSQRLVHSIPVGTHRPKELYLPISEKGVKKREFSSSKLSPAVYDALKYSE